MNKYKSKAICLLIALSLILMNIPFSHAEESPSNIPGERVGFVTVSVEDSLPIPEGKDWKQPLGQILPPVKVALYENDTMMDCIERACEENDVSIGWGNESKTYINQIAGLKEKEKGDYSGWMGTLNDWFTNEGFKEFSYSKGNLKDGDVIRLQYTQNLGQDLGQDWNSTDRTVKKISFSEGNLSSEFSKDKYKYELKLDKDKAISIFSEATNKKYQVKHFLNGKEICKNEPVRVKNGDKLEVKCGMKGWAPDESATEENGKVYSFIVKSKAQEEPPVNDEHVDVELLLSANAGYFYDLYDSEGRRVANTELEYKGDHIDDLLGSGSRNDIWRLKLKPGQYTLKSGLKINKDDESFQQLFTQLPITVKPGIANQRQIFLYLNISGTNHINKKEWKELKAQGWSSKMDVEVRSSSGELMKPNFTFKAKNDSSKFEYLLRADEGFSYTVKGRFLDKRLDVRMFNNLGNIKIKNNYFTCTIDKEFLKKTHPIGSGSAWAGEYITADFIRPEKVNYRIRVPKGLKNIKMYAQNKKAYYPFEDYNVASQNLLSDIKRESLDENYDVYTFKGPKNPDAYGYPSMILVGGGEGTGYVKSLETIILRADKGHEENANHDFLPRKMGEPPGENQGYAAKFLKNDIYTNIKDEGMYRALDPGEEVELNTFRVTQGTGDDVGNTILEPDKHYKVMYGDTVSVSGTKGSDGREWVDIKASDSKKGVSIVAITYDETGRLRYNTSDGKTQESVAPAIDPANTGIAIYDVGGSGLEIDPNIKVRKYDTIYFPKSITGPSGRKLGSKEFKEFTFEPKAASGIASVEFHRPIQTKDDYNNNAFFADNTWEKADVNGSKYTVKLRDGRNIIRITDNNGGVRYFTLRARAINVKTKNLSNEGKVIKKGDKIRVTFSDLDLPLQKLSAIYNPGFPDTTYLMGKLNGKDIIGPKTQYDIVNNNYFEFEAGDGDEIKLSGIRIHSGHFGSALDAHCEVDKNGLPPNLNAAGNDGIYCYFDDVSLPVEDKLETTYPDADNKELKAEASKDKVKYTKGVSKGAVIYWKDGQFDKFDKLTLDGEPIDKSCYEISEGSIRLKLSSAYLDTLSYGEHRIKMTQSDGAYGEGVILIAKKQEVPGNGQNPPGGNTTKPGQGPSENPNNGGPGGKAKNAVNKSKKAANTGDNGSLGIEFIMLLAASGGFAFAIRRKKNTLQ